MWLTPARRAEARRIPECQAMRPDCIKRCQQIAVVIRRLHRQHGEPRRNGGANIFRRYFRLADGDIAELSERSQ
jgi:hypothetical protein